MSTLSGFVFFSHQIGSFIGVWLGGYLFDHTGSYQVVWLISIALGIFAALVNLPIEERAIERAPLAAPGGVSLRPSTGAEIARTDQRIAAGATVEPEAP